MTYRVGLTHFYVAFLCGTSVGLIILGQTTSENMEIRRLEDRINIAVAHLSPSQAAWYALSPMLNLQSHVTLLCSSSLPHFLVHPSAS
jgi:hypothetical protein